jgi:hypothetical protein
MSGRSYLKLLAGAPAAALSPTQAAEALAEAVELFLIYGSEEDPATVRALEAALEGYRRSAVAQSRDAA